MVAWEDPVAQASHQARVSEGAEVFCNINPAARRSGTLTKRRHSRNGRPSSFNRSPHPPGCRHKKPLMLHKLSFQGCTN